MAATYRAGNAIEDHCRACKTDRQHTIIAVDALGRPIRVQCDYCQSQHNYRGGPRIDVSGAAPPVRSAAPPPRSAPHSAPASRAAPGDTWPLVTDRERSGPQVMLPDDSAVDLELLLRRVIREEAGISAVPPAEKWRGGSMVLRPGRPGVQEKSWPIETFFHKVVMLRNRLRTLEQQVNASELPDDQKVRLQAYITGCYGTLTSFNVLFAEEADQFRGQGE